MTAADRAIVFSPLITTSLALFFSLEEEVPKKHVLCEGDYMPLSRGDAFHL
jgi:hypothetical protein